MTRENEYPFSYPRVYDYGAVYLKSFWEDVALEVTVSSVKTRM